MVDGSTEAVVEHWGGRAKLTDVAAGPEGSQTGRWRWGIHDTEKGRCTVCGFRHFFVLTCFLRTARSGKLQGTEQRHRRARDADGDGVREGQIFSLAWNASRDMGKRHGRHMWATGYSAGGWLFPVAARCSGRPWHWVRASRLAGALGHARCALKRK
jgi:hypothetical protein